VTLSPPVALALLLGLTLAAEPTADPLDVSAVRDKLVVVDDGQGHYLAVIPFGESIWDHLYWSQDGKDFYQQRVFGGGSNGTESFDRSFWEPRVRGRNGASFGMHEGTYKLWCGERTTVFKPLEQGKASAMLASGTSIPLAGSTAPTRSPVMTPGPTTTSIGAATRAAWSFGSTPVSAGR